MGNREVTKTTPTNIFTNSRELQRCLEWWQNRLFLNDWIIKGRLVSPDAMTLGGDVVGENMVDTVNKCCIIKVLKPEYYGDSPMLYCAEKILVHELLHCKYNLYESNGTYESDHLDMSEHSLLEQMAKTLIMVKYDLPFDYFVNEEYWPY